MQCNLNKVMLCFSYHQQHGDIGENILSNLALVAGTDWETNSAHKMGPEPPSTTDNLLTISADIEDKSQPSS